MNVSIITVNYKVGEKVLKCIESIEETVRNLTYEMIVVDNEGDTNLENRLNEHKHVKYIKAPKNIGFGAGNNLGVKHASGKYLFFLNPDTVVTKDAIKVLYSFLEKDKTAGMISPLILKNGGQPLDKQGYKELNLTSGVFTYSFLRKFFPKYSAESFYSLADWDKTPIRQVETVYGAAMMISKDLFDKAGGFDEDFFLYFEENDLSKRVRDLGFKLYVDANARIIHEVGQSTGQYSDRDAIYAKSRYLYFKKHFGNVRALMLEALLKVNKINLLLLLALAAGLILRLYNLQNGMPFIGDQGWFYLSARDMLIYGKIPLVGITSSHIWLHQGPLWTYMLAVVLPIVNFDPLAGAYLTIFLGLATIIFMYKICSEMFSQNVGILASFLYAVSPAVVASDRMPFDPSPIPLFTLLYFYSVYRWLKGSNNFFPLTLFFVAILYNLELATFSLFFPLLLIFLYGLIKRSVWIKSLKNLKIIFYSIAAFLIPMLPVLIYDFYNGFKQTIVFGGWIVYKLAGFVIHQSSSASSVTGVIDFLINSISGLILPTFTVLAFALFFFALLFLLIKILKQRVLSDVLLMTFVIFSLGGVLANQVPSQAYLPIIFPFVITITAIFTNFLVLKSRMFYLLFFILLITNFYSSASLDKKIDLGDRIKAVNKIIALTRGQKYNLIGKGNNSQFESFTMNYRYLLWWKGHPVSSIFEKLKVSVEETNGKIIITKL